MKHISVFSESVVYMALKCIIPLTMQHFLDYEKKYLGIKTLTNFIDTFYNTDHDTVAAPVFNERQ
jgi:hypothetical protein